MYSHEQIKNNLVCLEMFDLEIGEDGGRGVLRFQGTMFKFQYSFGMGWEHISVSAQRRCPEWNEMCFFKDIFWPDSEACIQYHPAKYDYVNINNHCLHIWRPINEVLPVPPKIMV